MQMDDRPSKMCPPVRDPAKGWAVALLLALASAACGPTSEAVAPSPGRSTQPRGGPTVAPAASSSAPERWARWPELAAWRVAIERAPSQHLAADHEAETLANDAASAYPNLGPARLLDPGAILVQRLYAPGAATPEALFVMVRRTVRVSPDGPDVAGWEYLTLDPAGFITERGPLEACVRCHAEAPHDGAFGKAR